MGMSKVQTMTRCALAAGLMAVCAWITLPGPVPFTLQTLGLFLTLEILGGKRGTWAVCTYLSLGIIGLPVFSGFQGGIGVLFGSTGGYLSGFMLTSVLYWFLTSHRIPPLPALVIGYMGCYCFGTAWYLFAFAGGDSLWAVLSTCVFPFLIPDALKLAVAHTVSRRIRKRIWA